MRLYACVCVWAHMCASIVCIKGPEVINQVSPATFKQLLLLCLFLCVWRGNMCMPHGVDVGVRGQTMEVSSLFLPCRSWGLDPGQRAWRAGQ